MSEANAAILNLDSRPKPASKSVTIGWNDFKFRIAEANGFNW